jgi:uncharacterized hydrophobic protein (TIGR00341 family)
MALRLLEVTVPEDRLGRIPELVEDLRLIEYWVSGTSNGIGTARFLLEAADAEPLSDRLVSALGSERGFRLILMSVEATVPVVEGPSEKEELLGKGREPNGESPRRISREELYEDVSQASRVTPVYLIMVALSSVVAAVGLIRGDVAIVIGAMVIAPLLGPNIALSLASTLGDPELAKRSLKAIGSGVVTAAVLALLMGVLFSVDPASPELSARTSAGLGDIGVALAAGAAGSLAFTSGVPAVVVGVMVAVALLPPLVGAGLLFGAGYGEAGFGALMLLVINVTCINLAAVAGFLIQRVRPRTWWEADRAKKATRIAVTVWVLMLAVLIGLIWIRNVRSV